MLTGCFSTIAVLLTQWHEHASKQKYNKSPWSSFDDVENISVVHLNQRWSRCLCFPCLPHLPACVCAILSESCFPSVSLSSAVKPNPPESVLVKEQEGYPKRLIVSWDIPSSWPQQDAFPLLYHIRYKPLGSSYWSEVSEQGQRQRRFHTRGVWVKLHQTDKLYVYGL